MNDVCPLLAPAVQVPELPAVAFQELLTYFVGPGAIALSAVNLFSAVPFLGIARLFQGVLTQPFLLFFARRKKGFGQVYESLSKRPVDLALVRIIDAERNRVVATRVTDSLGRFLVLQPPGKYRFVVQKEHYDFPTKVLAGERFDSNVGRIYTGGSILHKANGPLEINIPVDGAEDRVTVGQALKRNARRTLNAVFAYSGVTLGALAVIIAWNWQSFAMLGVHIILFLLFSRLTYRSYGKPWGKVTDQLTNEPLPRSVVRILDAKFNRVLETVVTNRRGQYSFIVGKNTYRLFADKPDYQPYRSQEFEVTKRYGTVKKGIELRPGSSTSPIGSAVPQIEANGV